MKVLLLRAPNPDALFEEISRTFGFRNTDVTVDILRILKQHPGAVIGIFFMSGRFSTSLTGVHFNDDDGYHLFEFDTVGLKWPETHPKIVEI